MKHILPICALLAMCPAVHAQDYCKRIMKDAAPDNRSFTYTSPFEPLDSVSVHVTRSINVDPDFPSDNFFVIFRIIGDLDNIYTKDEKGGQIEKEEKKVVIQFDDNSKIIDDTIPVSHDITDDKLQAVRYVYYPVTDGNAAAFISKKIVKFSLAGYEKTCQADSAMAVQHYVECIKAVAKQQ